MKIGTTFWLIVVGVILITAAVMVACLLSPTPVKAAPVESPRPWCPYWVAKLLWDISGTWQNGAGVYHVPFNSQTWTKVADALSIHPAQFEELGPGGWIKFGYYAEQHLPGTVFHTYFDTITKKVVAGEIEIDVIKAFPAKDDQGFDSCGPDDPKGFAGSENYQPIRTQADGTFSLSFKPFSTADIPLYLTIAVLVLVAGGGILLGKKFLLNSD